MKFPIIYADPAWEFKTRGAGNTIPYSVMTTEDIATLPVADIATPDSALIMWATYPKLKDALLVGEAWGFEYKTAIFTWLKRSIKRRTWHKGRGYYTMSNAEPCLIFTRGKPPTRLKRDVVEVIDECRDQPSLFPPIIEPVMAHSVKPEEAYYRIERLFAGPYVELYARRPRQGWVSLGGDIDGHDLRDSIPALSKE